LPKEFIDDTKTFLGVFSHAETTNRFKLAFLKVLVYTEAEHPSSYQTEDIPGSTEDFPQSNQKDEFYVYAKPGYRKKTVT
jgi:hypothetical protein